MILRWVKKCIDYIATDMVIFFIRKMLISFLFLHENICCWYSLEAEALLMSTHNIGFRGEIRKILCGYPLLSVAMDYIEK